MITNGILGFKSDEHIIFYPIISKSEIEIARILHVMMDLKKQTIRKPITDMIRCGRAS
jgi:toxin ParE1/3/4